MPVLEPTNQLLHREIIQGLIAGRTVDMLKQSADVPKARSASRADEWEWCVVTVQVFLSKELVAPIITDEGFPLETHRSRLIQSDFVDARGTRASL
jgi:hypothetical protein